MRVVFLGSGAFAIPSFAALIDAGHDVAALVTQPDREKGRGRSLAPPPLKPVAEARGVPVHQPRKVRDPAAQETLPRYRGAAPIQWAIVNGERETGVTTMLIDEGLDTGPVLLSRATPIGAEETAADLEARLAVVGAEVLLETLRGIGAGTLKAVPQDHAHATLAPIIRKEDGRLDWTMPAEVLARRVRGFHPWPGTFTAWQGQPLKVLRARTEPDGPSQPGEMVAAAAGVS